MRTKVGHTVGTVVPLRPSRKSARPGSAEAA